MFFFSFLFFCFSKLIEQRPQEFLAMLNQVDEGDDGDDEDPMEGGLGAGGMGQGPPGTVTITLSPQDQQAINRVRSFSRLFHRISF